MRYALIEIKEVIHLLTTDNSDKQVGETTQVPLTLLEGKIRKIFTPEETEKIQSLCTLMGPGVVHSLFNIDPLLSEREETQARIKHIVANSV